MVPDLCMVRMRFDLAKLFELGRRRRLPLRQADLGYLIHCELKELFGAEAPGPFSYDEPHGRMVPVLAYTRRDKDELVQHAATFADPAVHAACDMRGIEEKTMPRAWPSRARFGFEVRACPVVRMSSAGEHHRKGAEVDAFLARCWKTKGTVEREAVYREWLDGELARRGGVALVSFGLKAFQRERLLRRDHAGERRSHPTERPDARFSGELEVTDGPAFEALLARGIGRHRAFGFGMLLLRPGRAC